MNDSGLGVCNGLMAHTNDSSDDQCQEWFVG